MYIRQQLLILFSILPLLAACKDDSGLPAPPIKLPFEVQKGNKVEISMRIQKCNNYGFSLRFGYKENDQLDRARVRKLVGGNEIDKATGKRKEPGMPTLVELKVSEISANGEKLILQKEVDPILTSWGADNFGKQIGESYLQPGNYRIVLEALSDAPEYIGIPISLVVGSYANELPSKQICPN